VNRGEEMMPQQDGSYCAKSGKVLMRLFLRNQSEGCNRRLLRRVLLRWQLNPITFYAKM
jgi:hypothetical protein